MRKRKFPAIGLRAVLGAVVLLALGSAPGVQAQDASAPAILQMFEARWDTIEDRMADIHAVGYGRMWVPPPNQASGELSVGYDVFDRFSFGAPRAETRYGTATSFKSMIDAAHKAGVAINPDLLWNHNGVGNRTDQNFVNLGGYPGFALTLPNDINGDFHDPFIDFTQDEILGQLAGLNDIAQEKNYQFIRHPTTAGDPNNIPAGTLFNQPDPNNARFYPDRDLGGTTVFDPRSGQNVTLYEFNESDPLQGDPVMETAVDLLMRNVRWMIQEFDVDGFRLDAARHFDRQYLDDFDVASFLAKREPLLDGSPNHVYSFIETGFDSAGFLQDFIRRDIDNNNLGQVGGNRDALDFRLFNRLKDNLTGNGLGNNWHGVRSESMDLNDDGLMNGSQGVSFTQSHDEGGAFLENVAHAYTLMLPGNALVYLNAEKDGPTGTFPQPGKVDALGGFYGDTITRLVGIRNTHGRGDFHERWIDEAFGDDNNDGEQFSNIYIYERSNSAVVGLNSRNDSFIETRTVQTDFAPGTVLVELTGNAADSSVDPGGVIPEAVRVDGSGQATISVPANAGHGRGYVIYGVAGPEGSLGVNGASGLLPGATPTGTNFGTARLEDIDVVTADSFTLRLDTTPVTLPTPAGESNPVRDVHADGDSALFKIDGGLDLNSNPGVDNTAPGSVAYGFEQFTTTHSPGYVWDGSSNVGSGTGLYEQVIDTTQLTEGRHYVTVRAFRHRNAGSGGDGGPAVYTDFKRTIYVDRLPPESEVASFEPFTSDPGNPDNRDLVLRSVDQTADSIHYFFDEPAATSDADLITRASQGQGATSYYDRDSWIAGLFGVTSGNHVVTIVSFEPTGNVNVQRIAGVAAETNIGIGVGDMSFDGFLRVDDLLGNGGLNDVLLSQNQLFNAAADADATGLIDNRDLFALRDLYLAEATDTRVYPAFETVLQNRGDVNEDGVTDNTDRDLLYAGFGGSDWLLDMDVDGDVDGDDVEVFVTELLRTSPGDFNLDGAVDAADYALWRVAFANQDLSADGDFDGDVDGADYDVWRLAYGFMREPLAPGAGSAQSESVAVPEPATASILLLAVALWSRRR